jgi:hypothetical protein
MHGRSPVLVNDARLLCGTPVWIFGAPRLAVLLGPIHRWSLVQVDVTCLLHGIPVWLSHATSMTLVHSASVTTVDVLDAVVRGVGPLAPRWLPQLDVARSPHACD